LEGSLYSQFRIPYLTVLALANHLKEYLKQSDRVLAYVFASTVLTLVRFSYF